MDTHMLLSFSRKHVAIILTMLFLLCQLTPKAQQSMRNQSDIVARLTRYDVKTDHQTAFRKAVSDYVHHSLNQESNVLSEAYYEQENPSVMWIIERWNSKIELEKAGKSPFFKAIESLSKTVLLKPAKTIDVKDLEPISKQQWRR